MSSTRPHPHHRLAIQRRLGSLDLDVTFELSAPWTLLFGPSGSGKSSILRAACGLLGRQGISFARHEPDNPDPTWQILQGAVTYTPPHLRRIRWAPQHTALFPHLSVRENVTFGLQAAGEIHDQALAEVLDLFQLAPLLNRRPTDLSGGERQRVSLARAFAAPGCRLILLDEPFSAMDNALRDQLLPKMRVWLRDRGIPVLSVTHDVEEALQLEAEVVLIHDGKLDAQGPAAKVLQPERDRLLHSLVQATAQPN